VPFVTVEKRHERVIIRIVWAAPHHFRRHNWLYGGLERRRVRNKVEVIGIPGAMGRIAVSLSDNLQIGQIFAFGPDWVGIAVGRRMRIVAIETPDRNVWSLHSIPRSKIFAFPEDFYLRDRKPS
jgi:hypothetical protein